MADVLDKKQIAEGTALCIQDLWDKVVGTRVLVRHWVQSKNRRTQAALDWLNTYASAANESPTIYVTNPETQFNDVHAGLWRHVNATNQKTPHSDHGITQTLYRVYSPEDVDELALLLGRYAYGHGVENLFGFERGESEWASVTFHHLKPDETTRLMCEGFLDTELLAKVLGLYQSEPAKNNWAYATRNWDDRTEAGTAVFTVLFKRVTWGSAWDDRRESSRRGKIDTRNDAKGLEVRGVPLADLASEFDGISGAISITEDSVTREYAIAGKSASELGNGQGALSAQVQKINPLDEAALVTHIMPTINTSLIKVTGQLVVEWRSISATAKSTLVTAFDACGGILKPSAGTAFSPYTFPAGYVARHMGVREHPTDPVTYDVVISSYDGAMLGNPDGIGDYGWVGPIPERQPHIDHQSGQIIGYRLFHTLKRVTVGRSAAEEVATGGSANSGRDPQFNEKKICDADVAGSFGKFVGWCRYYIGYYTVSGGGDWTS